MKITRYPPNSRLAGRVARIDMSEHDYQLHRDEYNGICMACGEVKYGETEPDAEKYECDDCGRRAVYGIEILLIVGCIGITG